MFRRGLLGVGLLCLAGCSARNAELVTVGAADEEPVRNAILFEVQSAIAARDFAALSAMGERYRSSRERTPSGLWKLGVYHSGLQAYLATGLDRDGGCAYRDRDFVAQWAAASPASPAPIITDAALLLTQAWCVRGPGYSNGVAADAWPEFRTHVTAAAQRLEQGAAKASSDPEYYAVKLKALRSASAGLDAVEETLDEATDREPYYHRTYFTAAWSYLPQWGGSFAQLERFARFAADKTGDEHDSFYARVFWSLEECGCEVIEQAADRKLLGQGMRDAYNLYPVRWNGQYFADLSCRLGDVEQGRQFLRAIHPEATGEGDFAALFAGCDVQVEART